MDESVCGAAPRGRDVLVRLSLCAALAACLFGVGATASPPASAAGPITEYPLPSAGGGPLFLTAGPDGNMWVTENQANKVAKVTPSGTVTEYTVPTASSGVDGITAGPDGNLWIAEAKAGKVAKLTTTGTFTEYAIPTADSGPEGIAAGPDGNLWITERQTDKIAKVTTDGTFTEYPVPTASSIPELIVAGPDGNMWFTELTGNKVAKITTSGTITEYPLPSAGSSPLGIDVGPDGNLWVAELEGNRIAKVTTGGTITEFDVPTAGGRPSGIAAGPGGFVWFTEFSKDKVGKIPVDTSTIPCGTTSSRCVVDQIYRDVLHRPAEATGLDFWAPKAGGAAGRADVAGRIARTREGRSAFVDDAYQRVLDRPSDMVGNGYWADRLLAGATESSVLAGLYASGEFYARAGGTDGGFVDSLSQHAVGHAPSAATKAKLLAELAAGATRRAVALDLVSGQESCRARAGRVYAQMLGRAPSAAERAAGATTIAGSGETGLVSAIASTTAYFNRAQLDRPI